MTAAGTPVMSARDLRLGLGRRSVLQGVDIELRAGEVVALLGPNGSGKTTLMKVLVGLLTADAGSVTQSPSGRGIGWVPQGGAVYQRLTVRENLELFARLHHDLPGGARGAARHAADVAQLGPWYDAAGTDLSGGLRQRLNVAVGLLGDPEVLLLDEPTTGVDLIHRTSLFRVLRERADAQCSVLFSTHSLEDARAADRVLVLVEGRIVYDGTLDAVAEHAPTDSDPSESHVSDAISRGLLALWGEGASV